MFHSLYLLKELWFQWVKLFGDILKIGRLVRLLWFSFVCQFELDFEVRSLGMIFTKKNQTAFFIIISISSSIRERD